MFPDKKNDPPPKKKKKKKKIGLSYKNDIFNLLCILNLAK